LVLNGEERAAAHGEQEAAEGFAFAASRTAVTSGLRQVDMARALGKPQAFVSYYESGEQLEDEAFRRAHDGLQKVILYQGKPVRIEGKLGYLTDYSDQAQIDS
jgi:hypothetical protein